MYNKHTIWIHADLILLNINSNDSVANYTLAFEARQLKSLQVGRF